MQDFMMEKRALKDCAVYIGENIIRDIVPYLRAEFEEGALLCVYDTHLSKFSDGIMYELKKNGYRVFAMPVNSRRSGIPDETSADVPEYVRYVLAIGAGSAAEKAKEKSEQLGIGWSLILTAPSTDSIMRSNPPKQVFIDKNVLINCPNDCIAAGYGLLLSSYFSSFENLFRKKVLAQETEGIEVPDYKHVDVTQLAFFLLQISQQKKGDDSADRMAEIMYATAKKRGRKPRLIGEYKFLASALISAFYSSFLGALSIDVMPPACIFDEKDKLKSLELDDKQKSIDFFDISSYFRISYILSEYRMDLLDKLSGIDIHSMQRFWRRLYPDAGYWLKGEITASAMLKCMAIAGSLSDNLLGYAYASGVMTKF